MRQEPAEAPGECEHPLLIADTLTLSANADEVPVEQAHTVAKWATPAGWQSPATRWAVT